MAIDPLPDIRNETHRLEIAVLIVISQIITLDLGVENKNGLRENVLTKTFNVLRKCSLVDPENYKADMAQNKLVGFVLPLLSFADESPLFTESEFRVFSDRRISFPHSVIVTELVPARHDL